MRYASVMIQPATACLLLLAYPSCLNPGPVLGSIGPGFNQLCGLLATDMLQPAAAHLRHVTPLRAATCFSACLHVPVTACYCLLTCNATARLHVMLLPGYCLLKCSATACYCLLGSCMGTWRGCMCQAWTCSSRQPRWVGLGGWVGGGMDLRLGAAWPATACYCLLPGLLLPDACWPATSPTLLLPAIA